MSSEVDKTLAAWLAEQSIPQAWFNMVELWSKHVLAASETVAIHVSGELLRGSDFAGDRPAKVIWLSRSERIRWQ